MSLKFGVTGSKQVRSHDEPSDSGGPSIAKVADDGSGVDGLRASTIRSDKRAFIWKAMSQTDKNEEN